LNLNLHLKNLRAEVQKNGSLGDGIGISAQSRVPLIDFLVIRLGTILDIQTGPASLGTSETPPMILLRFDGPYSPRMNLLGPDWRSTGSSTRSDSALRFSTCALELGDVIFAFFDSMACLVFRKSATKLIRVGCAILTDQNSTSGSNEVREILNSSYSMLEDLSQPEVFRPVEIDDSVEERELELNALAATCVLDCHSVLYDWPPRTCAESQRHLRTQY
jgi:hypothetical protein